MKGSSLPAKKKKRKVAAKTTINHEQTCNHARMISRTLITQRFVRFAYHKLCIISSCNSQRWYQGRISENNNCTGPTRLTRRVNLSFIWSNVQRQPAPPLCIFYSTHLIPQLLTNPPPIHYPASSSPSPSFSLHSSYSQFMCSTSIPYCSSAPLSQQISPRRSLFSH